MILFSVCLVEICSMRTNFVLFMLILLTDNNKMSRLDKTNRFTLRIKIFVTPKRSAGCYKKYLFQNVNSMNHM